MSWLRSFWTQANSTPDSLRVDDTTVALPSYSLQLLSTSESATATATVVSSSSAAEANFAVQIKGQDVVEFVVESLKKGGLLAF